MPSFIHVKCACGREVRAKLEQDGAAVRCWNCGRDVPVHVPHTGALWKAFPASVRSSCRAEVVVPILIGALLIVAALHIPYAGPFLAFAVLAAGGWFYQDAAAVGSELGSRRFSPIGPDHEEDAAVDEEPQRVLGRALLAVAGAAALVAPVLIRNGGRVAAHAGGSRWGMLVALGGWFVIPLLLAAANARTRRGPIAPRDAARGLAQHPITTFCALAFFPLGLFAIELVVAVLLMEQGAFTHALCDVLPPPRLEITDHNKETAESLVFNYDGTILRCPFIPESREDLPVYRAALEHGHWFVANLPLSLVPGAEMEFDPTFVQLTPEGFWMLRLVLSSLLLTGAGLLLSSQAHWIGYIAGLAASSQSPHNPPSERSAEVAEVRLDAVTPALATSFAPAVATFTSASPASPGTPVAIVAEAPVIHDVAVALTGPPGAATLLIIDDERAFAHALGKILVGRGFTVLLAADAAEGHRLALSASPDLIVLDLLLPDRPGLELCRELRADPRTSAVPIIIATYKSGADDEVAGLTQGADDYLAKPYVVEVLIARIQKQLRDRKA